MTATRGILWFAAAGKARRGHCPWLRVWWGGQGAPGSEMHAPSGTCGVPAGDGAGAQPAGQPPFGTRRAGNAMGSGFTMMRRITRNPSGPRHNHHRRTSDSDPLHNESSPWSGESSTVWGAWPSDCIPQGTERDAAARPPSRQGTRGLP